jgi:hypothetical protein
MKRAIAGALLCVVACSTPPELPVHGLESFLPAGAYTLRVAPLVSDRAVTRSESDRYLGVAIQPLSPSNTMATFWS